MHENQDKEIIFLQRNETLVALGKAVGFIKQKNLLTQIVIFPHVCWTFFPAFIAFVRRITL